MSSESENLKLLPGSSAPLCTIHRSTGLGIFFMFFLSFRSAVGKSLGSLFFGLMILIALDLVPPTAQGQFEKLGAGPGFPEPYCWEEYCVRFSIEFDGQVQSVLTPTKRYRTPIDFLQMLNDPKVADALEITESQRRRINDAVSALERARKEYDDHKEQKHNMTTDVERQIFERPVVEGIQTAQEILLSHQSERLRQVLLQYQVARVGLCGAWIKGDLGKLVPLSPQNAKKLVERYVELFSAYAPELQELRDGLMDECWDALSQEQQKDLELRVWPREKFPDQMLCIWVALNDLNFAELLETKWRDPLSHVDPRRQPYLSIIFNPQLTLQLNGQLVAAMPLGVYESIDGGVHEEVLGLFRRDAIRNGLDLSENQLSAFDAMMLERSNLSTLKRQDWNENGSLLGYEVFTANWKEILNRQNDREYDIIHSELLPGQLQEFRNVVLRCGVNRTGLLFNLIHGPLRDELGLNNKQLEKLHQLRGRWHKKLKSRLVEIERELNSKVLSEIGDEAVTKFHEVVGDDLGLIQGNVELFTHVIRESPEDLGIFEDLIRETRGLGWSGYRQKSN